MNVLAIMFVIAVIGLILICIYEYKHKKSIPKPIDNKVFRVVTKNIDGETYHVLEHYAYQYRGGYDWVMYYDASKCIELGERIFKHRDDLNQAHINKLLDKKLNNKLRTRYPNDVVHD